MRWLITFSMIIAWFHSSAQFYTKFAAELKAAIPSKRAVEKVVEKYKAKRYGASFSQTFNHNRFNFLELECLNYYIHQEEDSIRKGDYIRASTVEVYFSDTVVVKLDLHKHYKTLLTYTDSSLLYKHITSFNDLREMKLEENYLFSFSSQYDIFGLNWGLRSSPFAVFQPMKEIYRLVYNYNQTSLIQLGNSLCNETKAYAAAGLYILELEDCELTNEARQLLIKLRVSYARVNFALGGCEIEIGKKMSDCLSNDFLNQVYTKYLSYKNSQKNKSVLTTY